MLLLTPILANLPTYTHLRKSLPEWSDAVQHLVEYHSEGPHVYLGADSWVVSETLGGKIPAASVGRVGNAARVGCLVPNCYRFMFLSRRVAYALCTKVSNEIRHDIEGKDI